MYQGGYPLIRIASQNNVGGNVLTDERFYTGRLVRGVNSKIYKSICNMGAYILIDMCGL